MFRFRQWNSEGGGEDREREREKSYLEENRVVTDEQQRKI